MKQLFTSDTARAAAALSTVTRRARIGTRPIHHGLGGYTDGHCRCWLCVGARQQYMRQWRRERRALGMSSS